MAILISRFFTDYFERTRIRFICSVFLSFTTILLIFLLLTSKENQTLFQKPLGEDFAGFYYAGDILNKDGPEWLYNSQHQHKKYHQLFPHQKRETSLPYVHPPWVAYFFRPISFIPYPAAFVLWVVLSIGLYLAGFSLIMKVSPSLASYDPLTTLCVALAFEPFLMECLLGGQLSAVAFFSVCLGYFFQQRNHSFASGMALGILFYKPTLLVLIMPMLVVTRSGLSLLGLAVSGLILAGISMFTVGWGGSLDYLEVLYRFSSEISTFMPLRNYKYVDINTFLRLLLGGTSGLQMVLFIILMASFLSVFFVKWASFNKHSYSSKQLLWATTLTGTPIINFYVGIYDSILIVAGMLITIDVVLNHLSTESHRIPIMLQILLVLLFVVSWINQPLAVITNIQCYTLVLLSLLIYQFSIERKLVYPTLSDFTI